MFLAWLLLCGLGAAVGPLKLDDASYSQLTAPGRNYTAVVLLTALQPQFGCQLCRAFAPEFDALARSSPNDDSLRFGVLDFADGQGTFQKLQLTTAPNVWLFPPGDAGHTKFDFTSNEVQAEEVAAWVSRHAGKDVRVRRPFNYAKLAITAVLVAGTAAAFRLAYPRLKVVLYSRYLWATASLLIILMCTGGHMFNTIRKTPYIASDGQGGISYIAGGFQNQFGFETQMVAAIYAVLSFATVHLAIMVPRIRDTTRQSIAVWVWSLVILCLFSYLLQVFKTKNGSYPFSLPPLL